MKRRNFNFKTLVCIAIGITMILSITGCKKKSTPSKYNEAELSTLIDTRALEAGFNDEAFWSIEQIQNDAAARTKTVVIGNVTYTMNYQYTVQMIKSPITNNGISYGLEDVYFTQDNKEFRFFQNTDTVCYYSCNDVVNGVNPISKEQAVTAAQTFLVNLLGENALASYSYDQTPYSVYSVNDYTIRFGVNKSLATEFDPNFDIVLRVDTAGNVFYYTAHYYNFFNNYQISGGKVEQASTAINDYIKTLELYSYDIPEQFITMNASGELYFKKSINVVYKDAQGNESKNNLIQRVYEKIEFTKS